MFESIRSWVGTRGCVSKPRVAVRCNQEGSLEGARFCPAIGDRSTLVSARQRRPTEGIEGEPREKLEAREWASSDEVHSADYRKSQAGRDFPL